MGYLELAKRTLQKIPNVQQIKEDPYESIEIEGAVEWAKKHRPELIEKLEGSKIESEYEEILKEINKECFKYAHKASALPFKGR